MQLSPSLAVNSRLYTQENCRDYYTEASITVRIRNLCCLFLLVVVSHFVVLHQRLSYHKLSLLLIMT
jgi:hypothetical protein